MSASDGAGRERAPAADAISYAPDIAGMQAGAGFLRAAFTCS